MDDLGSTPSRLREIGVAVIGFGWMGEVHTRAYQRVHHHFPEIPVRPRLVAVVDEAPERATDARERYGFDRAESDWRRLLDDPLVEAVSVTSPNFLHREMGSELAAAGKHLWIEKPVGLGAGDARAVAAEVERAGVQSVVGFNYRNAPAVRAAKEVIDSGRIGTVTHAAFRMLGDYAADPAGAFTWRYETRRSGHGVLHDLASHAVDLVRFLLGGVERVVSDGAIFVPERRRPSGLTTGHARSRSGELVPVENEDWVSALLRLDSGARVTLEASRVAVGSQNDYGFVIHGTSGAVAWDFRRMGELQLAENPSPQDASFQRVFVGPGDGDFGAFQPGAGISMGYDDLKVIEAADFLRSIAEGASFGASIVDAVATAEVLDAMAESASTGEWRVPARATGV